MLQNLPIGIQSFRKLREDGYKYVDKTELICQFAKSGGYFFLSRPRRFGKSLVLSTLKELYQGDKTLFKGLWAEEHWDWGKKHTVVHFSFSKIGSVELGLTVAIEQMVDKMAVELGISLESKGMAPRFEELIKKLAARDGRIVLLIDEYDKPIIDHLDEPEKAIGNRNILKAFYSIIKDSDIYLELLFITGVSKFSKTSIFSELNNLEDITLVPDYATLTGYTQMELETNFKGHIDQFASETKKSREELLEKVREWYNGYTWNPGGATLYNPFSVMLSLKQRRFDNFWFETGTPTFLVNIIKKSFNTQLENIEIGASSLKSYDVENLSLIPILFQTGYLTIATEDEGVYTLKFPNREVKESLLLHLLAGFRHEEVGYSLPLVLRIKRAFRDNNLEAVFEQINSTFASIPYQHFDANREGYYHSIIHVLFSLVGLDVRSEVHNSRGRLDVLVQTDKRVYIFEFKLDESADAALQQIQDRGYAEPYRNMGKELILGGVNFDGAKKCVGEWKISA